MYQRCLFNMASIHHGHFFSFSHFLSSSLFLLSLCSECVTDHYWDGDQRKSSKNGRKLQGERLHGGLPCDSAAGAAQVCVRERKTGSALQITRHQSCQVASTEPNHNRVLPLTGEPNYIAMTH